MMVCFIVWDASVSDGDVLGIHSTLFGDNIYILRFGAFILDIMVGDARPTPKLSTMIHGGYNKPMNTCLLRDTHLNSFDTISTQFWWILFFHIMIFVFIGHTSCNIF